jgi:hypothetical protein
MHHDLLGVKVVAGLVVSEAGLDELDQRVGPALSPGRRLWGIPWGCTIVSSTCMSRCSSSTAMRTSMVATPL